MKTQFKAFYKLTDKELKDLWENGLIVFDTNVLLDLYRYQSKTRDEFLALLKKVKDRIWIPHQVGLEYQRNRLKVISDQHKMFAKTRGVVQGAVAKVEEEFKKLQLKDRHSHINPDEYLDKLKEVSDEFVEKLIAEEAKSTHVNSEDKIRDEIDKLFSRKVGKGFKSQEEIEKAYQQAEDRYDQKTPPGYADEGKEDAFSIGGLKYQAKYGDYLFWRQLVDYCAARKKEKVILIISDQKEDWWHKVSGQTIGPRIELIEEIQREGKVKLFHMYNLKRFLELSVEHLETSIGEESIQEVEIISLKRHLINNNNISRTKALRSELSGNFYNWLSTRYSRVLQNTQEAFDYIVQQGDRSVAIIWELYAENNYFRVNLEEKINDAKFYSDSSVMRQALDKIFDFEFYLIVEDVNQIWKATKRVKRALVKAELPFKNKLGHILLVNYNGLDEDINFQKLSTFTIGQEEIKSRKLGIQQTLLSDCPKCGMAAFQGDRCYACRYCETDGRIIR